MRFAYIDSQGKEVGIPTVEALQLRIELGAITEETMFYDASKDRWDPAGEHEIFRTLSREIRERGEDGPRPPAPKAMSPVEEAGDAGEDGEGRETGEAGETRSDGDVGESGSAGEERTGDEEGEPPPARPRAPDPFDKEQDPMADAAPPGEGGWEEVDLDDVHETSEDAPDRAPTESDDWDLDLGDFGSLDLAPELEEVDEGDRAGTSPGAGAAADAEEADEASGAGKPRRPGPDGPSAEFEGPGGDLELEGPGGDLELERPLAEQHAGESSVEPDDDIRLATPLSELEPGPEGVWDEGSGEPDPNVDPGEFGRTGEPAPGGPPDERRGTGDREEGVRRERARRDPYDRRVQRPKRDGPGRRSSRPAPRRSRGPSPGKMAAVVVALALVGAGGWFGWSALSAPDTAGAEDDLPVLPPLPADLEVAMREAADGAWDESVDSLRAMAERAELPPEPNPDWLAGIYLANAGDYPDVRAYWQALQDHLDDVRTVDGELFLAAVERRVAASDVPAEARDTVVARARAGFDAAASGRRLVYDRLERLIQASLELHEFLEGNEGNITYEPAVGLSRDPVTEAVPSTAALGEEMRVRVVEIPNALEALGTLDRVTTDRILDVFHRQLGSVTIP